MDDVFLIAGTVFLGVSAVIHVVIFALESVLWSRPAIWQRFGITSAADAETIRPMAFNQGFYNLFLALGAGVGVALIAIGHVREAGVAVALFALGSMLLASLVLVISNPRLARAALTQGTAPLLGIIALLLAFLLG